MKVFTIASLKGGVGKTTLSAFLALALSSRGKTLAIDLDAALGDVILANATRGHACGGHDLLKSYACGVLVIRVRHRSYCSRLAGMG